MNVFDPNHRVAPVAGLSSVFDLAVSLGVTGVVASQVAAARIRWSRVHGQGDRV